MDNSNNSVKIIGALLLGAAIGGAMGILFAPCKGSDTRKKILSKGNDLSSGMKEKFDEFLEDITDKFEKVKEDVSDFVEETKAASEKS
jgi:gas vesicle protein